MSSGELKPCVKQMLEVGKACDLNTVAEAYGNYMNHYDCFFYIPEYHNQHAEFVKDLMRLGFVIEDEHHKKELVDMSIDDALAIMEKVNASDQTS